MPVAYTKRVEIVFEIIAAPNRPRHLESPVSSPQSVGEIERQLRCPQHTVSKHLRFLRDAGFRRSTVDAQARLYRLQPSRCKRSTPGFAPVRRFWSAQSMPSNAPSIVCNYPRPKRKRGKRISIAISTRRGGGGEGDGRRKNCLVK